MFRGFSPIDRKLTLTVAFIESIRLMGIFMILPVFTTYGESFTNSGLLIGFAFGAYALTMALFQIPFGLLADRIGRKKTIIIGLSFFVAGNIICFHPVNISLLIMGRLVSGAGAISSVGTSLVQANVPPEKRNIAMAIIGIPVGISFLFGIFLGPLLSIFIGISPLFLITAVLGVLAILMVANIDERETKEREFRIRVPARNIMIGIAGFMVSVTMMVFFYFLPVYHISFLAGISYPVVIFFPVLVGGLIAIFAAGFADRDHLKPVTLLGLLLLLLSIPMLFIIDITRPGYDESFLGLLVYLTGFSIYEITFPTLISRSSDLNAYSTNFSIFNMFQHFGQLTGSVLAGLLIAKSLSSKPLLDLTYFMVIIIAISLLSTILYFRLPLARSD